MKRSLDPTLQRNQFMKSIKYDNGTPDDVSKVNVDRMLKIMKMKSKFDFANKRPSHSNAE